MARTTLGVGIIGLRHLHPRDYVPLFEQVEETQLVAVAEQDRVLLKAFTEDVDVEGYTDWTELLRREDIHLIALFLPHSECPGVAVQAAQMGKHILVEKPMAASAEGARRMVKAAQTHGVKLTTPYVWRYHPVSREIKRLIQEGVLGDLIACEGRCAAGRSDRYLHGNAPWMVHKAQSGGGPMLNLGVHWIDLFRWLLQDEVVRVSGEISHTTPGIDIEDNAFALLRFSQGAVATLDISYSVPPAYPRGRDLYISLRGTRGIVSWSPAWGDEADELLLCTDAPGYETAPLRRIALRSESVRGYSGVMGLQFMGDLAASILNDQPPPIPGEEGVRNLEIVEAIYRAAETAPKRRFGRDRQD